MSRMRSLTGNDAPRFFDECVALADQSRLGRTLPRGRSSMMSGRWSDALTCLGCALVFVGTMTIPVLLAIRGVSAAWLILPTTFAVLIQALNAQSLPDHQSRPDNSIAAAVGAAGITFAFVFALQLLIYAFARMGITYAG